MFGGTKTKSGSSRVSSRLRPGGTSSSSRSVTGSSKVATKGSSSRAVSGGGSSSRAIAAGRAVATPTSSSSSYGSRSSATRKPTRSTRGVRGGGGAPDGGPPPMPSSSSAGATPALKKAATLRIPKESGSAKIKFSLADLNLSTTLGTGTFGRVRLVKHLPSGKFHALKILKKSEVVRLKQVDHIKNEVRILSSVHHPFIVNLLGHMQDERKLYMLLQYVPGGELFSHLRKAGRFDNDMSRFYAAEIASAFAYLHEQNIVYRDLKPENLLIGRDGHVKIADFGFAKQLKENTYTLCGTPEYLAPEIIASKGHGLAVDWWALGILIYEMLAGFPPFFDENPFGIYQKILAGRFDFPRHFDPKARDIVRRLLESDKTRRLGCMRAGSEDVLGHKWFNSISWEDVVNCRMKPPIVPDIRREDDTRYFDEYPESSEKVSRHQLSSKEKALFADFDSM